MHICPRGFGPMLLLPPHFSLTSGLANHDGAIHLIISCSGLHPLMTIFTFSVAYVTLTLPPPLHTSLLLGLSLVSFLVTNPTPKAFAATTPSLVVCSSRGMFTLMRLFSLLSRSRRRRLPLRSPLLVGRMEPLRFLRYGHMSHRQPVRFPRQEPSRRLLWYRPRL